MNRLNGYQWTAMGIMILLIVLLSTCNGQLRTQLQMCLQAANAPSAVGIFHDTITLPAPPPDTIHIPVYQPYKIAVPDSSLLQKIDSLLRENAAKDVLLAYYETRNYFRILKDDTVAYAALYDTVYQNQLKEGEFIFQLRQQPQRITTTITQEKQLRFRLFAGGFAGGNKAGNFEAGLSAMAIPKNDRFALRYDHDFVEKAHRLGLLWKLSFRN